MDLFILRPYFVEEAPELALDICDIALSYRTGVCIFFDKRFGQSRSQEIANAARRFNKDSKLLANEL